MGAQPFRAVVCQSFSAVLTGVPQITTWTTPQRCCRNGWPLWAETMQLWCGSLRKRRGSNLRARVLEEMENSRSPVPRPPEQAVSTSCRGEAPLSREHLTPPPQVLPR